MDRKNKQNALDLLLIFVFIAAYGTSFLMKVINLPNGDSWVSTTLSIIGVMVLFVFVYRLFQRQKRQGRSQVEQFNNLAVIKLSRVLKGAIILIPMLLMILAATAMFFPFKPTGEKDIEVLRFLNVMPLALIGTAIMEAIMFVICIRWYFPLLQKKFKFPPERIYFAKRVVLFSMCTGINLICIVLVFTARSKMLAPPDWIYWYYASMPVVIIAGWLCWPRKNINELEMLTEQQESQKLD